PLPHHTLLSFPTRRSSDLDPYHRDCMETVLLLKRRLGVDASLVHVSFQSRFGAEKWLEPYTEPLLREWARQGITRVDVMCPGFLDRKSTRLNSSHVKTSNA